LPAPSRATAVRVCDEPLLAVVVSQGAEYGAAVTSAPTFTPSSRNCTPTTPMLSEALAVMVTVPETLAPDVGDVIDTVGGVVSGGGPFETVTATGAEVVRLLAASRATAARLCEPLLAVVVSQETE